MCGRAVGERRTTESVASVHKLRHCCGAVHTVRTVVPEYAINRKNEESFLPLPPRLKHSITVFPVQYLNPCRFIIGYWNCIGVGGYYLPQARTYKHVHAPTQIQRDYKAPPQPLFNPISAYCDHFSLSCSLQNNEIQLPPSD